MRVDALIDELSVIHPKGYDLSLGRITRLLSRLGDPQLAIPPAIHIAGTNGKGSTLAFCRAILEAAGFRVHAHTSPHLVNWHERFRIGAPGGGQFVSDDILADAIARVAQANRDEPSTIFEILTAAMFLLFSEHQADFSLIEVGLGGRFDATNVLPAPFSTIITNIALDHKDQLGDREELIAAEKAGIIKPGCPVIIGPQIDSVLGVIEETAMNRRAPVFVANRDFSFFEQGGRFVYQDEDGLVDLPMPRLRGAHQLANAATAIACTRFCDIPVDDYDLEQAMHSVYWPGRMERLRRGRLYENVGADAEIWIDGGHNTAAAHAIASVLADLEERAPMPVMLVAGMLTTKEPRAFFECFSGLVERVFTVPVNGSESAFSPRDLAQQVALAGLPVSACLSVQDALSATAGLLADREPVRILICGSLYLLGEVLRLNGMPPL
jgi:dihydrofolate synthase / folylpolyglutamate synthase